MLGRQLKYSSGYYALDADDATGGFTGGDSLDAAETAMTEHLSHVVSTLQRAIAAQPAHSPWPHAAVLPAPSGASATAS